MTAPAVTRFVTRAEWGAVPPRSFSRNVQPVWLTYHYLGADRVRIGSLADGIRLMRATQEFHMGPDRGWADFAYSFAFDDLGHVYAGRGFGVRTAAQGTTLGNDLSLAALYLGGGDQEPTPKAIAAAAWIAAEHRRLSKVRPGLRGHRDWKPTGCPGNPQALLLRAGRYEPSADLPLEDWMSALNDAQQRELYNAVLQTRDIAGGARGAAQQALAEARRVDDKLDALIEAVKRSGGAGAGIDATLAEAARRLTAGDPGP